MKRLIFLLAALAAVGCEPVFIGEETSEGRFADRNDGDLGESDDGDLSPNEDEDEDEYEYEDGPDTDEVEVLIPKTLYVTGVEYPEGADWQKDIGYDIEGSKLFLMRDGERIVELDVGYDKCVSVDADMHRCIDGHLYTDFSTDDETVVKVDGVEAYRYQGREMIVSMCVHEGSVHTLTAPRDGSAGWKYRTDGEEIYSQTDGKFIGGLYVDNGDIVFSYKMGNTYYMSVNGSSSVINFNSKVSEVFDIRRIDGNANYVSASDGRIVAVEADTVVVDLGENPTDYNVNIGIHYDGKDRFYVEDTGSAVTVWQENETSMQYDGSAVGFYLCGNSYVCVLLNGANETEAICCGGETNYWPAGGELLYETCMATDGIGYTVALINRSKDNAPALWKNGTVTNYDFNGFFTHVDYW